MKKRQGVLVLASVIAFTSFGCGKKIESSAAIVDMSGNATLGVGAGGKLEFVSESKDGPQFLVHFTPSLCSNGNDIAGSPATPAACNVPEGSDGTYEYSILPTLQAGTRGAAPTARSADDSGGGNHVYVDGCKGCDTSDLHATQRLTFGNGGTTVFIKCNGNAVAANPKATTDSPGQVVEWKQIGPSATVLWRATLPKIACTNGTVAGEFAQFGTLVNGGDNYCTVGNPTPQQAYTTQYKVEIQDKTTGASCSSSDLSLTIPANPAAR